MRYALLFACLAGCSSRPLYLPDELNGAPRSDGGVRDFGGTRDLPAAIDLAPCARTMCGGECVDLASNARHCGACGHDCGGDPCSAGRCAMVTVLDNQSSPYALAIDESNVYLRTYNSYVGKISIATGAETRLGNDEEPPGGIAVDAAHVYWASFYDGVIKRVPIAGGTPATLASGQHNPDAVAVDAQNVYWINVADTSIVKMPLTGGAIVELARVAQGNPPTTIASDGTSVFWLLGGGYLSRVPIAGGRYERVLDLYLNSSLFALDGGWIYFCNTAEATPARIDKVRSDGTGKQVLSKLDPTSAGGIASDGKFVYYTTWGAFNGTVRRISVDGGMPEIIAADQRDPRAVVVNSKFVYWVEEGGGTLRRMAK